MSAYITNLMHILNCLSKIKGVIHIRILRALGSSAEITNGPPAHDLLKAC